MQTGYGFFREIVLFFRENDIFDLTSRLSLASPTTELKIDHFHSIRMS